MTQAYLPKEYDIFIGLDVDKKSFAFTVTDHNEMKRSKKIPSNPEKFYSHSTSGKAGGLKNVNRSKRLRNH